MKDAFSSLTEIKSFIWSHLAAGVASGKHPWHTAALATQSTDGPQARIVVIRATDPDSQTLTFHTDARSPKFLELTQNPKASLLLYDAESAVQLRASGQVEIHCGDNEAHNAWSAIPDRCLRSYGTIHPPGTPLPESSSNLPDGWDPATPTREAGTWTREHFAVIRLQADRLDFLHLRAKGHQRAQFIGTTIQQWVAP